FFLISLVLVGLYVYKKTGDAFCGILVQLPAILYLTLRSYGQDKCILPIIVNIDAEPMLIIVINLFLLCFFKLYFDDEKKPKGASSAGLFGIVCGLGVAVKVTFLPMWLIPVVLLQTWRDKTMFLITSD